MCVSSAVSESFLKLFSFKADRTKKKKCGGIELVHEGQEESLGLLNVFYLTTLPRTQNCFVIFRINEWLLV